MAPLALACGSSDAPRAGATAAVRSALNGGPGFDVTFQLPAGVSPGAVFAWGAGNLVIEHDVLVTSPAGGSFAAVSVATPGASSQRTTLGRDTRLDDVYSTPPATLDGTIVAGDVRSEGLVSLIRGATVAGKVASNVSLGRITGPRVQVEYPLTSVGSVLVKSGGSRVLLPGRYDKVELRGKSTVTLRATAQGGGRFYLDLLTTEPDSTLLVDDAAGPVTVYVRGNVGLRGTQRVASQNAARFLLAAFGTSGSADKSFAGTWVQPFGTLLIGVAPGGRFTGAFWARALSILQHSTVSFVPSNLLWEPEIPNVVQGGIGSAARCPPLLVLSDDRKTISYASQTSTDPNCPVKFCDAAGNVLDPQPTLADFNATNVTPVTCQAMDGGAGECPIDPATLTNTCTTASDCAAGEQCGVRCLDARCETVEHRCGKLADCDGLSGGGLCFPTVFYQCPYSSDDVGTVSAAEVANDLAPQTQPKGVPAGQHAEPLGTYPNAEAMNPCDALFGMAALAQNLEQGAPVTAQGSDEWGISFLPRYEHELNLTRQDFGDGKFNVRGGLGLQVLAKVPGKTQFEAVSLGASASVSRCGVHTRIFNRVFGVDVDEFAGVDNLEQKLQTLKKLVDCGQNDDIGSCLGTDPILTEACEQKATTREPAVTKARVAALVARQVRDFIGDHGTSKELCEKTLAKLGPLEGVVCDNPAVAQQLGVFDAWKGRYDRAMQELEAVEAQLESAQNAVVIEDKLDLVDQSERFNRRIARMQFGIGPFSIFLDLDLVGDWSLFGELRYSLRYSGGTPSLVSGVGNFPPLDGDVRATAGPVASAGLLADLLAFAGAGLPDVAEIGIEGTLNLIDTSADFDLVGSLMRISEKDQRVPNGDTTLLQNSSWTGDLVPAFPYDLMYRWAYGYEYGAKADLSLLSGRIDVVARAGKDPFSLEYRQLLTDWNGLSDTFTLAGSGGGPLIKADDLGASSDLFPLTRVPNPPTPQSIDFGEPYLNGLYDPFDQTSPTDLDELRTVCGLR